MTGGLVQNNYIYNVYVLVLKLRPPPIICFRDTNTFVRSFYSVQQWKGILSMYITPAILVVDGKLYFFYFAI
jgi:hypothetical protein